MKSVMTHQFSQVPRADIPRSSFNRSHGHKTTMDADYLVPIIVDPVLPGDTFNVNANFYARLATPLYPIMDNLYFDTFFFFVPNRLLWDNWEKFCGAQTDPTDSIDYTIPLVSSSTAVDITTITGGDYKTLSNYFGLPPNASFDFTNVSALPYRAYNLIWNEWFRDQNLQNSVDVDTDNGPDTINTQYTMLKRGKRHDYFTSCLPWPQKGDAVDLPLGTTADVATAGIPDGATNTNLIGIKSDSDNDYYYLNADNLSAIAVDGQGGTTAEDQKLYADLTNATAATINELRLAFQTQRLLERDARSGTRYTETILAHYGVTVPDFRLQRPEYLGGGSTPINVTPVAQTSGQPTPAADDKLGQLAAIGTAGGTHGFTKSFVEHGYIIGLANLRGDITYSQGLERDWSKSTRYDIYYPVLAQIGEQTVLNKELWYTSGDSGTVNDAVFGYQERYAEYRYKPSRLTGLFGVDIASNLSAWHLSEDFSTLPSLGSTFIQSNTGTPLDRAIAVPSEPHLLVDFYFDMKCARPMPLYGVPGNLDHF